MQASATEPEDEYSSIPGVDCVINPSRVIELATPVAGVIEALLVERSSQVTKGQTVARLRADLERSNVNLARFRAGIQSEIKLGQINLDFDMKHQKRIKVLHQQKVNSLENSEVAKLEVDLSRWKLEQARELQEVRKLELYRAEEQLQQKMILAPFDGFVLDTYKDQGEYVEDKPILRLAQLDPLVVEAIVPMENFGEVKVGMMAEVLPEILAGKKLSARVTIVDRIGDTASNTFGVKLVMPNPEHRIPAGLKCVLKFKNTVIEPDKPPEKISPEEINPTQDESNDSVMIDNDEPNIEHKTINSIQSVKQEIEPSNQDKQTEKPSHSGYFVVIPQKPTDALTRKLIQELRAAGISDLQEMDSGPYQGKIMLGFYYAQSVAKRRLLALKQLGFDASIYKRD